MRPLLLFTIVALSFLALLGCSARGNDNASQDPPVDPYAQHLNAIISDLKELKLVSVEQGLQNLPASAHSDPRIQRIREVVDIISAYHQGDLRAAHRQLALLEPADQAILHRHLFTLE